MSASRSKGRSIELSGLDGANPLGFLAAVGALVVARSAGEFEGRLRWKRGRTWIPVVDGLAARDAAEFCVVIAGGLKGMSVAPEAERSRRDAEKEYQQARTEVKKERQKLKDAKLKGQQRRDAEEVRVRPLMTCASERRAQWLAALRRAVPRPELAVGARLDCTADEYRELAQEFMRTAGRDDREALDLLAAFGTDACLEDGRGARGAPAIQATPFCFIRGSGGQEFLDTVRKLLGTVTPERVAQALFSPWLYADSGLSMRWDPVEDKRYALTDVKPADEGARTVWMANLLAYRSLALFPCAPVRQGLGTSAWRTIDRERVFTWPLWEFAAEPDAVRTLLQLEELGEARLDPSLVRARGVAAAFRARRIRFPPAGASYKLNFSPPRAVC